MSETRSFPNSSVLLLNGEPTFDQWVTALEALIEQWDARYGNYPYSLPLVKSTGLENWRDSFDDGMTPQEAFDEDQKHWEH